MKEGQQARVPTSITEPEHVGSVARHIYRLAQEKGNSLACL